MRTHRLDCRVAIALLCFSIVTATHAATLEDIPLLSPSTNLYGNCGPVPRCFPTADDLEPSTAVIGGSGQVSIFERQAAGSWQLTAELLDPFAPEPRPYYNSNFGYLAAIDGDLLAVAATPPEGPVPVIYIFSRQQAQWSLLQTFYAPSSFGDVYLTQIAIQHDTLVVSKIEYATDQSGRTEATVLVFSTGGDGLFQLRHQLDPGANQDPDVAYKIAVGDSTLALAMTATSETPGSVYLYRKTDRADRTDIKAKAPSTWRLQQVLQPRELTAADRFGSAISLSGDTLAVAAPGVVSAPPALYPGAIFIYGQQGHRWKLQSRVIDPVTESVPPDESHSPPAENPFGTMLALSGTRLLVKHISNAYAGEWSSGILFERQQGAWTPVARLSAGETNNIQNTLLAGTTALLSESPYDGIFPATPYIYELPALTNVAQ